MTTKKKIIITCISAIIISLLVRIFYFLPQNKKNENIISEALVKVNLNKETDNQKTGMENRISNDFLTDDDVSGLTGCSDQNFLNQFSGYKLVKKVVDEESYDIYVYNMNMDLTNLTNKINQLIEKATKEKPLIEKIDKKLSNDTDLGYSYNISDIEKQYRMIDIIYTMPDYISGCLLESENSVGESVLNNIIDKKLLSNIDIFLGDLLSGNININYLPSLDREKESRDYRLTYKNYKDGILSMEAGGQDGFGIYLEYIKNVGNKIYRLSSEGIFYVFSDDIEINDKNEIYIYPKNLYNIDDTNIILKNLNCLSKQDCNIKANKYAQDLLNGKETFPKYQEIYDKFTKTIDEVFGE